MLQAYEEGDLEKIQNAVRTIEKRGHGLLNFVESYRKLTRVPTPVFQKVALTALFTRIRHLITRRIEEHGIRFTMRCEPEHLTVRADENLLEQVLLNLLDNAIMAVEQATEPHIELIAQHACTHEGALNVQCIQTSHHLKIDSRYGPGAVIDTAATDADQLGLFCH